MFPWLTPLAVQAADLRLGARVGHALEKWPGEERTGETGVLTGGAFGVYRPFKVLVP